MENKTETTNENRLLKIAKEFDEIDKMGDEFLKENITVTNEIDSNEKEVETVEPEKVSNHEELFKNKELNSLSKFMAEDDDEMFDIVSKNITDNNDKKVPVLSEKEEEISFEEINKTDEIIKNETKNVVDNVIDSEEISEENNENHSLKIPIDRYIDISSNSKLNKLKNFRINKEFFGKINKKVVSLVLAGTITLGIGIFAISKHKNKSKENSGDIKTSSISTTVSSQDSSINNSSSNDDLDVELEIKDNVSYKKNSGENATTSVVKGSDNNYYENKTDASISTGTKVASGYQAPNGKVYINKDEYNKKSTVKSNNKSSINKNNKKSNSSKYYKASDGTYFKTEKDKNNYEKSLNKKYYKASDGTLFESKTDRDNYEKSIKKSNTSSKVNASSKSSNTSNTSSKTSDSNKKYYEASDGTLFETKEDRDKWNEALKNQNNSSVQSTSTSVRKQQINRLLTIKQELITSSIEYNNENNIKTIK